jgi:hypothetical protein
LCIISSQRIGPAFWLALFFGAPFLCSQRA